MKRFFSLFVLIMVCLVFLNSMTGYKDRSYKESVSSVVSLVNRVGDVSSSVLDIFITLPVSGAELVSDLPTYYQKCYVEDLANCKSCSGLNEQDHAVFWTTCAYSDARYILDFDESLFERISYYIRVVKDEAMFSKVSINDFAQQVSDKLRDKPMKGRFKSSVLGGFGSYECLYER